METRLGPHEDDITPKGLEPRRGDLLEKTRQGRVGRHPGPLCYLGFTNEAGSKRG